MIQKAGMFTLFNERPVTLVYHEKCFHLMDLKVKLVICLSTLELCFQPLEIQFGSVGDIMKGRTSEQCSSTENSLFLDTKDMVGKVVKC